MNLHSLTDDNYFSFENNAKYMGSSQFKAFLNCEASALAELRGECTRSPTTALLIGSYVDAYFEGTLESFKQNHPEIFTKSGELKAQYRHADYMIQRIENDELFSQYMSGEKQKIMVGNIAGVDYKIKIDSYHADRCIVDLKCVKDFNSIYNSAKKNRQHFIDFWGYTIQAAIYREIVRQNIGKTLPFYIAAVTKEEPEPDIQVYWIPDKIIDEQLENVINISPRFQQIKDGKLKPQRCGKCTYCRATKILIEPKNYLEECEEFENVQ